MQEFFRTASDLLLFIVVWRLFIRIRNAEILITKLSEFSVISAKVAIDSFEREKIKERTTEKSTTTETRNG